MKRLLYFAAFLILSSFSIGVFAQSSVVAHVQLPFEIKNTIIREHIFPATVSYVVKEDSENGVFLYADNSMSATYLPIDSNYMVSDFVIDNDTVWFCGNIRGGKCFFGFFDINDFFFGSHKYYIASNAFFTTQSLVTTLSKLVSYIDAFTVRHIVAIGTTELGQYCVVNVTFNAAMSSWNYETGEVPASSPETMVDIKVTDVDVFTGGMYLLDPNNPGLVLRVYDRSDVFASTYNIQDYANEIVDASSQYSFCLGQVSLLQMSCNEIAVAAFYKSYQNGNISFLPKGTYIGQYGIGDIKHIINHRYSILAPHIYYNGGWKLYGFSEENPQVYTFNLLQEYEMPNTGFLQSVVYELSVNVVNGALPFSYVTTDDYYFWSIDGHYSTLNYLMNGLSMVDNVNLIYNMGQQGVNDCLDDGYLQPVPIYMIDVVHDAPFSINSGVFKFKAYKANLSVEQITLDCSSKSNR